LIGVKRHNASEKSLFHPKPSIFIGCKAEKGKKNTEEKPKHTLTKMERKV